MPSKRHDHADSFDIYLGQLIKTAESVIHVSVYKGLSTYQSRNGSIIAKFEAGYDRCRPMRLTST